MPNLTAYRKNALKNILWVGFLVGSLDGLAALLLNYNVGPAPIFKFIASGAFGQDAFKGGAEMVVAGIVFHYLIAWLFATAFYMLYPFSLSILKNKYVVANVYGGITWLVMNMIVVPLSKIGPHKFEAFAVIKALLVLIICVGLPIALIADKKLHADR
ncbi:hypothetical protein ACFQZS_15470 [Mucilaginibacter calamicampi]|uniref:DUF1440 domain-containing protein n=1 Tax=Mucilaginibacter calamicampi TaxID=1302352 RepID=A0ABW2YZR7_9SPHI